MLRDTFLSTSVCFHYVRQKESVEQWSKRQPRQFLFLLDGGGGGSDDIALPPEEAGDPVAVAERDQNKVAVGIEGGVDFLAEFEYLLRRIWWSFLRHRFPRKWH